MMVAIVVMKTIHVASNTVTVTCSENMPRTKGVDIGTVIWKIYNPEDKVSATVFQSALAYHWVGNASHEIWHILVSMSYDANAVKAVVAEQQ